MHGLSVRRIDFALIYAASNSHVIMIDLFYKFIYNHFWNYNYLTTKRNVHADNLSHPSYLYAILM